MTLSSRAAGLGGPAVALTAALLLALGLLVTAAPPAHAATFVVNTITDESDTFCNTDPVGTVDCSLRDAVAAANANGIDDDITLQAGQTYVLTLTGAESVATWDLDVDGVAGEDLVINGNNATIDASFGASNTDGRVFDVTNGRVLTLNAVTVTGGDVTDQGGGIFLASSSLNLTDSTVTANRADNAGGGIGTDDFDAITLLRSTISGNSVTGANAEEGGGIDGSAAGGASAMTITQSTISGNYVQNTAGPPTDTFGGGIHLGTQGTLTIASSLIQSNGVTGGNSVTTHGGGLYTQITSLTVTNSTFDGNRALGSGGGAVITNLGGATHTFTQAAFTQNTAGTFGGGLVAYGQPPPATSLSLTNSTFSGNTATTNGAAVTAGDPVAAVPGSVALTHVTVASNTGGAAQLWANATAGFALDRSIIGSSATPDCATAAAGGVAAAFTSVGLNVTDAPVADCDLVAAGDVGGATLGLAPLAPSPVPGTQAQGRLANFFTRTHALLAGSAALNTIPSAQCANFPVDQRNQSRPVGTGCEKGAWEGAPASTDLTLTKVVDPTTGVPGDPATFTITVTNASTTAATNVVVTDTVDAELPVTGATSATAACTVAAQVVTCNQATLPAAGTIVIEVDVDTTVVGTWCNDAIVTNAVPEATPANNTASACIEVEDAPDDEPFDPGTNRCEGAGRIETAILCSMEVFPDDGADAVVLTRSDLFPDAQAGTPLAVSMTAPLLLSEPDALNADTAEEIDRVLPDGGDVYLLGGTVALSQAVEDELDALGFTTTRYGGVNRFETAAIIADLGLGNPDVLLAANGGDFADSVIAGAASLAAGTGGGPAAVILTSGPDIPPETQAYLDARGFPGATAPELIAVGAPAATAFPDVEGIVGATRFETAIAVAERFFTDPQIVGLATGLNFPDALTGGAIVGSDLVGPGPMLLTDGEDLPDSVADYLASLTGVIEKVVIFGGTAAISQDVQDEVDVILGFPAP